MKHPRTNWLLRWGGVAVCLAVALLYVANGQYRMGLRLGPRLVSYSEGGSVGITWRVGEGQLSTPGSTVWAFKIDAATGIPPVEWRWLPTPRRGTGWASYWLPLWMPLVIAVAPTAQAWRSFRRRRRPGTCGKCGYDLAGLAGGVCPECGRAVRN